MKNLPCPVCDVPLPGPWQEYPEFPFCSRRCKLIDLGRWLDEGYRAPSQEATNASPDDSKNSE